jgi:hypothetical protein
MKSKRKFCSFLFLSFQVLLSAQSIYKIERMPFNSAANSEMAPVIYRGGLIFSSDMKNEIIQVVVDQSGNFLYNLYFTARKENDKWTKPELFSKSLASKYNQSSASINPDGKTLYYASNFSSNSKTGSHSSGDTLRSGIFISKGSAGEWSSPEAFQFNSDNYDVGYPSISPDGQRLFFSARNPDGFGGYDIYYSDKTKNSWGQPVNIGAKINTAGSEVYPFLFNNSRLYFASNGHGGMGALDIFYSDFKDGVWQTPVDLPKPFNSKSDDFALTANADYDTGYFSSNRNGSDDIFRFVSGFPSFSVCDTQVEETFCYEFHESGTVELDTTSLKYEWDLGDGTKIQSERTQHCYAVPGNYLVSLNVIDTLTKEVAYNQAAYELDVERAENPYIIAPDTAYKNSKIIFDASNSTIKKFKIQNYYWDFGDETIATDVKSSHIYLKSGIYTVRLGITGNSNDSKITNGKACIKKQITIIENNK